MYVQSVVFLAYLAILTRVTNPLKINVQQGNRFFFPSFFPFFFNYESRNSSTLLSSHFGASGDSFIHFFVSLSFILLFITTHTRYYYNSYYYTKLFTACLSCNAVEPAPALNISTHMLSLRRPFLFEINYSFPLETENFLLLSGTTQHEHSQSDFSFDKLQLR